MSFNSIAECLDVDFLEVKEEQSKKELVVVEEKENLPTKLSQEEKDELAMRTDFGVVRETLKDALDNAGEAVEEIKELARQTESPRAYEVLNQTLGNIATISKTLIETHKMVQKEKKEVSVQPTSLIQNNIMISTEELLRKIKSENMEKVIEA